nr:histone H1-like [Osmia lignaria]
MSSRVAMEEKSTGNTSIENTDSNTSPAKKTSKTKSLKSQRSKVWHPPTSEMVKAAIRELKDRKGSSLQAIKKYIASTYKVDGEKFAPYIKKYLKTAVTSGAVIQTKGKGASGSFKLSVSKGSESKTTVEKHVKAAEQKKKVKKSVEKKTTPIRKQPVAVVASKKANPVKKTETAKKSAATAKKAVVKAEKVEKTEKVKPVAESKTKSKSKKTTKAPAAKTKTPRPKKAVTSKAVKSAAKK